MSLRFIRFPLSLVVLLLLAGPLAAATVLVWGDSLSAGYGLRPGQAWPSLLQQRLHEHGYDTRVVNASVSGETSAGGRSRLDATLERVKPDVLVLALGANDGLRGLPLAAMRANLLAMIDAAGQAGARTLLVGMRIPPNYGARYATEFRESFREVAEQRKVPLLPFLLEPVALRREMFQSDGLHPTAEAQPLILDPLWGALQPLLAKR